MDPGKPLFQRPAILGLIVPVAVLAAVLAVIVYGVKTDADYAGVGDCVQMTGSEANADVKKVDCGSADANYEIVGKLPDTTDWERCKQFADAGSAYTEEQGSRKYTLCLAPVK